MAYDGYINIDTHISTTEFKTGITKMQTIAQNGAKVMITSLAAVTAAVAAIGGAAIKVGSSFESEMSKVSAISGATGDDLYALTEKAEEMGATTKFSATESAQALQYMAMAGWKTEDMLSGIKGIMNLAAADGLDLATTSDIVTDALTAFGLKASDSSHFADVLATASSNANTNVSMLGESFKYAAPLAGTLGYSIEDVSLALGLMANSGIKGSQAGTSLKDALANLAKPTKKMKEAIDKLQLSLTEADGTMKPLRTVLTEMREAFGNLSTAEQASAASAIFGKEAMAGMLAIINSSDEDFNKLAEAIENADGTAASMAATMQDNLRGQITILKSSLEGLGIQIYNELKTPLSETAAEAINAVGKIADAFANGGVQSTAVQLGNILATALSEMAISASQVEEIALSFIEGFTTGISNNLLKIRISSKQIVQSLIDGVIALLPLMVDSASELIGVAAVCVDRFIDGVKKNSRRLGNAAKDIIESLVDGIVTLLPKELEEPIKKTMATIEKSFDNGGIKKALDSFKTALKKVGNSVSDIVLKFINPLATAVDKLTGYVDKIVPLMIAWATAFKTMSIIKAVTTFISGMTAATAAETLATAASAGTITLKQIAVSALTGKITLATAAQYAWNMAMNANPIGLIITAVAALGVAIGAVTLLTDNQTAADKELELSQNRLEQQIQRYNDNLEIYAETLTTVFEKSQDFESGISTAGNALEGFNENMVISTEKQQELSTRMEEVQNEITQVARTAVDERRQLTQTEIERLEELFAKEKELADQQLQVKQEYQNVVKDMAEDLIANEGITLDEYEAYAQQYINTAQETRNESIKAAQEYKTNYLAEQRSLIGEAEGYTQEWYDKERTKAEEQYQESVSNANQICADTLSILSNGYLDKSEALSEYVDKMSEFREKDAKIQEDYTNREIQLKNDEKDAINKAYEEYAKDATANQTTLNRRLEEISKEYDKKHTDSLEQAATERSNLISDINEATGNEVVQDNLAAWMAMEANTELYGGKLTSKGAVVANAFISSFDYLDSDMKESAHQAMDGMMYGLQDKEPALYAKADSIASNIIYRLRSAFDIHSPSKVTRKIFTQVIDGGIVGTEKEAPKLYEAAEDTAEAFTDKMEHTLSATDLVSKMTDAVYGSSFSLKTAATARVEHIISQENSMAYQKPSGLTAQGNIETHIHIDGREAAIVLTPYISEELAFT